MSAEVGTDWSSEEDFPPAKHGQSVTSATSESSAGPNVDSDAVSSQVAVRRDEVEGAQNASDTSERDQVKGAQNGSEGQSGDSDKGDYVEGAQNAGEGQFDDSDKAGNVEGARNAGEEESGASGKGGNVEGVHNAGERQSDDISEGDQVKGAQNVSDGQSDDSNDGAADNAEEEECGFCLFMKAGPCGKKFSHWEDCVEKAETTGDNIVEKCWQMTRLLKQCMEVNPEYYGPVLQAERSLQEESAAEGEPVTKPQVSESNEEEIPAAA